LLILDALEIVLINDSDGDGTTRVLNWHVVQSKPTETILALNFEKDDDNNQESTLRVTFWDTKYFRDSNEKEISLGTQVQWRIFRQL